MPLGFDIMRCVIALSEDYVDYLAGDDNYLFGCCAVGVFGCLCVLHNYLFYRCFVEVLVQFEEETCLSIKADRIFDFVFFDELFVKFGPFSIADGCFMSETMVEFFGDMRSKRRKYNNQRFEYGSLVTFESAQFVLANHKCRY